MKTKYKLITPVAVKTRVNECENNIDRYIAANPKVVSL